MLAENLARLQAERGETNYRLAKILGVHQSSVANWKSGKIRPHPRHIHMISEHYGVPESELLADGKEAEQ